MTATLPTWADVVRSLALPVAADPGGRVVVVSAHPDDEVLGVGAWLATQSGRAVSFVVATDGEQSHPHSPTVTPDELRGLRRAELAAALDVLGHPGADTTHLGLRDAALPDDEDLLADRLAPLLADASLVLAPHEHDGHADHDTVGRVVRAVAPLSATVWRFPVWRWVWTTPDTGRAWLDGAVVLPTTADGRRHKHQALRAFRTQLEPLSDRPGDEAVVTDDLLVHALQAPEVVIA